MEGKQDKESGSKDSSLINRKGVKKFLEGYHISQDMYPELEEIVKEILNKAMLRATGGRRRTILARDL